MDEIMTLLSTEVSARTLEQNEALAAHEQLTLHRQMVEVGLASMCLDLKNIRDKKHFIALGYDDFGAYTKAEHGIEARHAYNYIRTYEKMGIELLQSNAKIGITKLLEIASLDNEDRDNLLESHSADELAAMNVTNVKQLVEENRKLREQITFLEEDKEQFDELESTNKVLSLDILEAKQDYEKLENMLADARNEREKAIQIAVANAKSEEDEKFKKEVNLKADKISKLQDEKEKLRLEIGELKNKPVEKEYVTVENLEKEKELAEAKQALKENEDKIRAVELEKAELEKKIKLNDDTEYTQFKFMFKQWSLSTNDLKAQFLKLDEEKQKKLKTIILNSFSEVWA